jgi:hypothetical protein
MKRFLQAWEYVMSNMDPTEISSEQVLTGILKGCLAKSKVLSLEYRLFCRLPLNHPDRNPKYVIFQIENHLREVLAEQDNESIIKAHSARAKGYSPGLGVFADATAAPGIEAGQFTRTCHSCGDAGHYAKDCPTKQKGKGKG